AKLAQSYPDLMGERDLAALARRLEDGFAYLHRRHAPAPVVQRRPALLDRLVQLVDHAVGAARLGRDGDLAHPLGVVEQEPIGRLAKVAALAAHQQQPEELLVRGRRAAPWRAVERPTVAAGVAERLFLGGIGEVAMALRV